MYSIRDLSTVFPLNVGAGEACYFENSSPITLQVTYYKVRPKLCDLQKQKKGEKWSTRQITS